MTLRRRLARSLPATLLVLAIGAYGALLYAAHDASKRDDARPGYVQLFGSDASARSDALGDPDSGALALGNAFARSSSARWHFSANEKAPQGVVFSDVELFVAGSDLAFYRRDSHAKISLDGKRIALLEPARGNGAGEGPFPVEKAALQAIDVPPGNELGFRFKLPSEGVCITSGCTLRIDLVRATWTVRRVGVVFATRAPAAILWPANGAAWIAICAAAAALAALSHAVLTLRPRATHGVPETEWKAR